MKCGYCGVVNRRFIPFIAFVQNCSKLWSTDENIVFKTTWITNTYFALYNFSIDTTIIHYDLLQYSERKPDNKVFRKMISSSECNQIPKEKKCAAKINLLDCIHASFNHWTVDEINDERPMPFGRPHRRNEPFRSDSMLVRWTPIETWLLAMKSMALDNIADNW